MYRFGSVLMNFSYCSCMLAYFFVFFSGRERELLEELASLNDPTASRSRTHSRPGMFNSMYGN